MKKNQTATNVLSFFYKHWIWLFVAVIFAAHVFLRAYQLEQRAQFSWDQVDNAWVSKNMIVNHEFPLVGMQARQGTGIFIGPAYYYFVAFFYWISNLDPVVSPIIAVLVSIFTFFVIFFTTKKIFSLPVALFAVLIHTVSLYLITFDRIQWPVAFIPAVSLLIFYFLYKTIMGNPKYLLPLGFVLGFSFHIHFTSVLYPIIMLLALPFFPRKKDTIIFGALGLVACFVWFVPMVILLITSKTKQVNAIGSFMQTYYHGFHLRRMVQIAGDAFIQFAAIFTIPFVKVLQYLVVPLFGFLYIRRNPNKQSVRIIYLVVLWVLVPWIIMTMYSGEISDYFYALEQPIFLIITSFILWYFFSLKYVFAKAIVLVLLGIYIFVNLQSYFNQPSMKGLSYFKTITYRQAVNKSGNAFLYGAPESYLYYFYTRQLIQKYGKY